MFIKLYLVALTSFLVLDGIWLSLIAKNFYRNQIGYLMAEKINFLAAGSFYLLYALVLVWLVIIPGLEKQNFMDTVFRGAVFGLVAYAAYDLTNHATIKGWPLSMTLVDMLWGAVLTGAVTAITYIIVTKL